MSGYRAISLALMLAFAATGALFLAAPDRVLTFFNTLSLSFDMSPAPVTGRGFYLVLAVGYMYMVTLLAFFMFRHPEGGRFPLLLVHAKLASSALSLVFFLLHARYLIYLANFAVDGAIGLLVLAMYLRMRNA